MSYSVLIADDHKLFQQGLAALLSGQSKYLIVGYAADGEETVDMTLELCPDFVVMDLGMPVFDGIEATRRIKAVAPARKVIVLSSHEDSHSIRGALRAGADGYLLKSMAFEELLEAFERIAAGHRFISRGIDDMVIDIVKNDVPAVRYPAQLTRREREVIMLSCDGKSSKEIAQILGMSPKTVDVHKRNSVEKLGMRNFQELLIYATKNGMGPG